MQEQKLYEDIARRTDGDIYIGVVGPVRSGKSTFIKRFMEAMVLPRIDNVYKRERARDELPQSGSGRTIMTAEPKFIPEEAAEITLPGGGVCSVRLIDSVGYMVEGAMGQDEDGQPRMVTTPWLDEEITMAEAAEIGTRKVIEDHSTIGIVVTTDGTIGQLARSAYIDAEERVIGELKAIGKPFIVLVNSAEPDRQSARALCGELTVRYGVTCMPVDMTRLGESEIEEIIRSVLYEFPLSQLAVYLPDWVRSLPSGHEIKRRVYDTVRKSAEGMSTIRQLEGVLDLIAEDDIISDCAIRRLDLGSGEASADIELPRALFYNTLGSESGFDIKGDGDLMGLIASLSDMKREYDKIKFALDEVRATGYGIVMPGTEEMKLELPEIFHHGGNYGVKLKASSPSIHMIRADIETEISPIVGNEKQSEDLINYLLSEYEGDTGKLWESNIFGKSLYELINEGLTTKLRRMPDEARQKLRETLSRVINEGSGGLICIIL